MKTKILALILAICCLSAMLVACSKETCEAHVDENKDLACDVCGEAVESETESETETEAVTEPEVVCDTHKDENADKICDACGKAVVVIVEQVKPEAETRVDMIVNTVDPNSTATKDNYINTGVSSNANATASAINFVIRRGEFFWIRTDITSDGTPNGTVVSRSHNVYNAAADKNLFENAFVANVTAKEFRITFEDYYFTVKHVPATVVDPLSGNGVSQGTTLTYYTYAGEEIYKLDWSGNNVFGVYTDQNGKTYEQAYADLATKVDYVDGLAYVTIAGTTYVIDPETDKIVHKENANTLVRRPAFDAVNGNYGYVYVTENGMVNTVYVYDLTEWIECVYSYDVPSYYLAGQVIVLDNGNLLIPSAKLLNANAVSYDAYLAGNKVDFVYTILDVATKSSSNVEFGYWIEGAVESAMLKDVEAVNVLKVYPVEDDTINDNAPMYLAVDNSLKVLFDLGAAVDFNEEMTVVGENFFKVSASVSGVNAYEILGATGNHVAYVPTTAQLYNDYLAIGGRLYTYNMNELVGYTAIYTYADYAIASKADELEVVKYYFVDVDDNGAFTTKPINIDINTWQATEAGFVAYVEVQATDPAGQPMYGADGAPVMRKDYGFYDVTGTLVAIDIADVVAGITSEDLAEDVYLVTFADGSRCIVRY